MPVNSMSWRAFSCFRLSLLSRNVPVQQMLVNTRLSDAVASYVGSSMSHVRHMESDVLFAKRSSTIIDNSSASHADTLRSS